MYSYCTSTNRRRELGEGGIPTVYQPIGGGNWMKEVYLLYIHQPIETPRQIGLLL